jgi:hypothetical protein
MKYNKEWFDIISIFSYEGDENQISVHVFKPPHKCKQFFIPSAAMESPTFWEDMHKLAEEKWNEPRTEEQNSACPRCGTTRWRWQRFWKGRAFCGFCGLDIPDGSRDDRLKLRVKLR